MKKFLLLVSVFMIMSCAKGPDPEVEAAKVKEIVTNFTKAFDNKDIDAMSSYLRDECTWYTLDGQIMKKEHIPLFFKPKFDTWDTITTTVEIFEVKIENRMALVKYGDILKITAGDQNNTTKSLHTMILLSEFGEWKIYHHHMSMQ